jgi:hypothetical protein
MILFEDVVKVLHRPMPAILLQRTLGFEVHDGWRITGVLVGINDPRRRMVLSARGFVRQVTPLLHKQSFPSATHNRPTFAGRK